MTSNKPIHRVFLMAECWGNQSQILNLSVLNVISNWQWIWHPMVVVIFTLILLWCQHIRGWMNKHPIVHILCVKNTGLLIDWLTIHISHYRTIGLHVFSTPPPECFSSFTWHDETLSPTPRISRQSVFVYIYRSCIHINHQQKSSHEAQYRWHYCNYEQVINE